MRRAEKAEFQAPDISFFVPNLTDQLGEREANRAREAEREARWQPRWTILFSLGAGVALWAGIAWLVGF
ncbi:MAG TPA: hypothetical protein VNW15_00360 [Rhizomicrobium sp.]|nr:hypothetical protein [Rhizomicrobium sp.]